MKNKVFLDTGYAIALSARNDHYHRRAGKLADRLEAEKTQIVTTRAVVIEIGNALSKPRYRNAAIALLDALEADPVVTVVPLSETLFGRALKLYRERPDKKWGLTDCLSFVVMSD